jgi:hypothetical protein
LQPPSARALAGCLRSLRQCHRSLESDRRHRGERRSWSIEQSASSYSSQLRPAVSEAASPPLVSQYVHRTVSPSRGSGYPSNEPSQPTGSGTIESSQPGRIALVRRTSTGRLTRRSTGGSTRRPNRHRPVVRCGEPSRSSSTMSRYKRRATPTPIGTLSTAQNRCARPSTMTISESFQGAPRKGGLVEPEMEAAGIEPASAVAPNRASTSVVRA